MSRESIIRNLPEDYVRRMRNWARAPGAASYAMTSAYDGLASSSAYSESPMPVMIGESQDTDRALQEVPNKYRQAVRKFWMYEGRSLHWLACQLQSPPLDYRTIERWLELGHKQHMAAIRKLTAQYHASARANAQAVSSAGQY